MKIGMNSGVKCTFVNRVTHSNFWTFLQKGYYMRANRMATFYTGFMVIYQTGNNRIQKVYYFVYVNLRNSTIL